VVARAIQDQMLGRGETHVLLDISHKRAAATLEHFPNIAAKCASLGVDITRDPIPVVPAQHYMCGGVQTGLTGQTSVAGLFACGEVSPALKDYVCAPGCRPRTPLRYHPCALADLQCVLCRGILYCCGAPSVSPACHHRQSRADKPCLVHVAGCVHGAARRQPAGQ